MRHSHILATPPPIVVGLDAPAAGDPALAGSKAANLARAEAAGLPVLPGFVLAAQRLGTAGEHGQVALPDEIVDALRGPWGDLGGSGRPLIVRSSSTIEDVAHSSMAGQFRSVAGVRGWPAFLDAVGTVLASARRPFGPEDAAPMAVLVQPALDVAVGGVLFGVDPVTGDRRRLVVEAVSGPPEALVSGRVTAVRWTLKPSGRVAGHRTGRGPDLLSRRQLRSLARLAAATRRVFGSAQDLEWGFDQEGALWLLQSRPVTAVAAPCDPHGPVLGPGPVAETFPDPLSPLEVDLWVGPLAAGVTRALRAARVVSRRDLERSPVVTTVGGWVAADLQLFGYVHEPSRWRALDPRRILRRLSAAWRLGRIRAGLPAATAALLGRTDAWLASVPPLACLDGGELVALLDRADRALRTLHGHEVLASTLLHTAGTGPTAAGTALRALWFGHTGGLDAADLVHRHPVVLALVPPRVGAPCPLPVPTGLPPSPPSEPSDVASLPPREALRLRARWVQELSGRAATDLGRRLIAAGRVHDLGEVRAFTRDRLVALAGGAQVEPPPPPAPPGPPLPALFRLAPDGGPVPVERDGIRPRGGRGAGGGRGVGPASHGSPGAPPAPGSVLVVRTLDPALATVLPGLAGLVAETGGVLSHLAILAREQGVPTVVGVHEARRRFPPGTPLLVDGTTGEVRALAPGEGPSP